MAHTQEETLRELIREANAATKDLRLAIRDAEKIQADMRRHIEDQFAEMAGAIVGEELAKLGPEIAAQRDQLTDNFFKQFDRLTETLMKGNKRGGPSLIELVEEGQRRGNIPYGSE